MPGIKTGLTFPGIQDISEFEFVYGRGIGPGQCIITGLPQANLEGVAGTLEIRYGNELIEFPDMAVVDQWLKQADDIEGANNSRLSGFRMCYRLEDHRRKWRRGSITGTYNVRLNDGTVHTPTLKSPAQLAALCLDAMGETGYDVSRMPAGVYPPIKWEHTNPALALDYLCRYVACEITGGERGAVVIWSRGSGVELPEDGAYINPPYEFLANDYPSAILLQGGRIVWQAKLKLKGHVIQDDAAEVLTPADEDDTIWPEEHPFSLPGITDTEERQDAFESAFRQFPVTSLADGTHNLPLAPFPILYPYQYLLHEHRLDRFTDLSGFEIKLPARLEGKFFNYGSDAESYASITPYTGRFLIRNEGNIIELPYPLWKLDSTGLMEEPDLYLLTALHLTSATGNEFATFQVTRDLAGNGLPFVLRRPELFYGVKLSYGSDGVTIASQTNTSLFAAMEAQTYLNIFQNALVNQPQIDREWLGIRPILLDGIVAQVRLKGSTRRDAWSTRAGRNYEFDLCGPTAEAQRIKRVALNGMEVACP